MNQPAAAKVEGSHPVQGFGERARSSVVWMGAVFGFSQALRLLTNIVLASLLFEEAFALMAIVGAVMTGLAMFSHIGADTSAIQNSKGDDPNFLNTVWTLQVIRGFCLCLVGVLLAFPLSLLYGSSDETAEDLKWLIPIVAVCSVLAGFQSAKVLTARRHLHLKEVSKIELIVTLFNTAVTLFLAWNWRSVFVMAVASVLSNLLYLVLSYRMLEGPSSSFRWHTETVKTVFSFGKWIFVSTALTFLALQLDKLVLPGMYSLAEVGVYSIAASLAIIVPTTVGHLQWSVLFPWYSRMLEQGMPIKMAFGKSRSATLLLSTFLCALLFGGAGSFFELAYDQRYVLGGTFLPILAIGAWFGCLDNMYGSAFVASGRPKWTAITNASKALSFLLLLIPVAVFELDIIIAALFLTVSDVVRWLACHFLGRRLGLRNTLAELGMLTFFLSVSLSGWWLVERAPVVSELHPFWRLAVLGSIVSLVFAPLLYRYVLPLVRPQAA